MGDERDADERGAKSYKTHVKAKSSTNEKRHPEKG